MIRARLHAGGQRARRRVAALNRHSYLDQQTSVEPNENSHCHCRFRSELQRLGIGK